MRKQKSEMMLMVFVQYLDTNDYVEQFLFCRLLAKNTTGKQRFKEHQLEWSDCVSVCTDGSVRPWWVAKRDFINFVKKENKNILVFHCLLHREKN